MATAMNGPAVSIRRLPTIGTTVANSATGVIRRSPGRGRSYSRVAGFTCAEDSRSNHSMLRVGDGVVRLADIEAKLAHLLVERRSIDIEFFGGRLTVPVVALEGALDDQSFG